IGFSRAGGHERLATIDAGKFRHGNGIFACGVILAVPAPKRKRGEPFQFTIYDWRFTVAKPDPQPSTCNSQLIFSHR
ncbi:MAG TPA: hypothetical protein VGO57_00840, partial [Verrucomicrobiae bacterium]